VPLVLWAHGAFTGRHWLERLARLTATPDLAVCNSQYTRAAFARVFPATRAEVVYPPVAPPPSFDPSRRGPKREGHGASPDTVVVVLVARLERGKGHAALLEALASLRQRPEWTAWIIGGAQRRAEDMYRAELERQTNAARIADRVHFLGQRDDVAALLWASDVYCQPNTRPDSFGISFIEALYAGLPVVTTDLGGAREIVTPACGVLVPPGDAPALRDALERMMADAGLRERLRAAAPARARALSAPEGAAERLVELVHGVVR
jgi:glycosyltransferase involved in cell wall biosynthesis